MAAEAVMKPSPRPVAEVEPERKDEVDMVRFDPVDGRGDERHYLLLLLSTRRRQTEQVRGGERGKRRKGARSRREVAVAKVEARIDHGVVRAMTPSGSDPKACPKATNATAEGRQHGENMTATTRADTACMYARTRTLRQSKRSKLDGETESRIPISQRRNRLSLRYHVLPDLEFLVSPALGTRSVLAGAVEAVAEHEEPGEDDESEGDGMALDEARSLGGKVDLHTHE